MDEYSLKHKQMIDKLKSKGMVYKTNWELVTGWKKTGNWFTYKYVDELPRNSGSKINGTPLL